MLLVVLLTNKYVILKRKKTKRLMGSVEKVVFRLPGENVIWDFSFRCECTEFNVKLRCQKPIGSTSTIFNLICLEYYTFQDVPHRTQKCTNTNFG